MPPFADKLLATSNSSWPGCSQPSLEVVRVMNGHVPTLNTLAFISGCLTLSQKSTSFQFQLHSKNLPKKASQHIQPQTKSPKKITATNNSSPISCQPKKRPKQIILLLGRASRSCDLPLPSRSPDSWPSKCGSSTARWQPGGLHPSRKTQELDWNKSWPQKWRLQKREKK